MLAVPTPSLTATLARGGNYPAVDVPLVALGTQSGTIEVVDVSANSVKSSLSVHNGIVRGLRLPGNSMVVSFSYTQLRLMKKSGGYINKLVVTCLRSGLNKMFRVLQKPERAPIRALRTSSSGRYLLILFRDAPVEVWAMTKNPIMGFDFVCCRWCTTREALAALRKAQLPDTAAMFILACREVHAEIFSNLGIVDNESNSSVTDKLLNLPDLDPDNEDVIAAGEYFGEYQRKLVHLCMDSQPFSD